MLLVYGLVKMWKCSSRAGKIQTVVVLPDYSKFRPKKKDVWFLLPYPTYFLSPTLKFFLPNLLKNELFLPKNLPRHPKYQFSNH